VPYRLEAKVVLPAPLRDVFAFFSDPSNLETITPAFLRFRVLTPDAGIRLGTRIDYRLRLRGLPMRWQSEITMWEPGVRFRDEQRRGPYRYWRHLHLFREHDGGTLVEDAVDYDVPGGRLVNDLLVAPELVRIFRFRQDRMQAIFGAVAGSRAKVVILRK
jgi:ligand-binding SRPBCC domain-containing protein